MLGNAGAMLFSAVGLGRRSRLLCLFAIAVLVVNIILTDQTGLLDVLTGALDVVLLVLVVSMWGRYAGRGR